MWVYINQFYLTNFTKTVFAGPGETPRTLREEEKAEQNFSCGFQGWEKQGEPVEQVELL